MNVESDPDAHHQLKRSNVYGRIKPKDLRVKKLPGINQEGNEMLLFHFTDLLGLQDVPRRNIQSHMIPVDQIEKCLCKKFGQVMTSQILLHMFDIDLKSIRSQKEISQLCFDKGEVIKVMAEPKLNLQMML